MIKTKIVGESGLSPGIKKAETAPAVDDAVVETQLVGESGLSPTVKQADIAPTTEDKILSVRPVDEKGKVIVGGGGAGGGNMVYLSPEDFTATYLTGVTLTLAGMSFVPVEEQFSYVIQVKADGSRVTYQASDYAFQYAAGVLTVVGAGFINTDLGYLVVVFGPDKAFSKALDATETVVLNQECDRNLHICHEDTTNQAGPVNYYYPGAAGAAVQGYRHGGLQYKLSDCTLEVEMRNHDDLDWEVCTNGGWDSRTGGVATKLVGGAGLAVQGVIFFDYMNVETVRVKIATFDATNLTELDFRLIP